MSNSAKIKDSWRNLYAVAVDKNYPLRPSPVCAVI